MLNWVVGLPTLVNKSHKKRCAVLRPGGTIVVPHTMNLTTRGGAVGSGKAYLDYGFTPLSRYLGKEPGSACWENLNFSSAALRRDSQLLLYPAQQFFFIKGGCDKLIRSKADSLRDLSRFQLVTAAEGKDSSFLSGVTLLEGH